MVGDRALVVGINRYPSAGVDPLEGAVADATRFHEWVTNPAGGGITEAGHAVLLTTPPIQADGDLPRPISPDLQEFFYKLIQTHAAHPGRRLYVFLSGHGISPSSQESVRNAALLMANAMQPNNYHCFPGNVWAEGVRSAALFREVILIMDCCRDINNTATVSGHIFGEPSEDAKNCVLLEAYATQWGSKSRELELPPDGKKRGVFTYSVLEVLNSGRMNGTVFKAAVKAHLKRTLDDEKKRQQTEIRGNPEDTALDQIVFNENAAKSRVPIRINGHPADPPRILTFPEGSDDSVDVPLDGWTRQNGDWNGTLASGQYELWLPTGSAKRFKAFPANPVELTVQP